MPSKVMMPMCSGLYHTGTRKRMGGEGLGKGTGSFLLDGGRGGQNSYANVAEYARATGRVVPPPKMRGTGIEKLSDKIQGLSISLPKKKKNNIKFEM